YWGRLATTSSVTTSAHFPTMCSARNHHCTGRSCVASSCGFSASQPICACGSRSGSSSGDPGKAMDLGICLNFLSPEGPCFDQATLPIPGSPVSLSMIDGLVETQVRGPKAVRVLEIGCFCGI